jgi:hypothetical protein
MTKMFSAASGSIPMSNSLAMALGIVVLIVIAVLTQYARTP